MSAQHVLRQDACSTTDMPHMPSMKPQYPQQRTSSSSSSSSSSKASVIPSRMTVKGQRCTAVCMCLSWQQAKVLRTSESRPAVCTISASLVEKTGYSQDLQSMLRDFTLNSHISIRCPDPLMSRQHPVQAADIGNLPASACAAPRI